MSNLHEQVICFSHLKAKVPNRDSFLDPDTSLKINKQIKQKEPILFLPTYLYETSVQDEKYQKAVYKIILMGIFRDGRRVNLQIDGIKPYFEVQITDDKNKQEDQINEILDMLNTDDLTKPVKYKVIHAKPFKYYQEEKTVFLKLYYDKLKPRKAALELVRKNGFITTSDDLASYYRVVCRDYKTTFSSWATIENYRKDDNDLLKGITYKVDISNYKAYQEELTGDLLKDKTMTCAWDIETWSKDGDVPKPEVESDCMFCVSMTFQWVNDNEPFLKVCLCDYPAAPKPGYLTIVCGTERNIIEGFAKLFELMRPEFIIGFNDSDYDWPWLVKRARKYKGLLCKIAACLDSTIPFQSYTDEGLEKWNYKKEHVKVEADTYVDGYSLMMHGYIPVDVRTIFRRLYPTAEQSSLKWFLAKNKLGGKEDMPYQEMFRIYKEYREFMTVHNFEALNIIAGKSCELDTTGWLEKEKDLYESLKSRLADINYYCVVDAQRCHELMKIRSVIMDHREVSNLAYTSVYDAFYRANGMKVRNLTIAVGQTKPFSMRFSNIANENAEEGKYPGAFVLPPRKGLKITKLSIRERIAKAQMTVKSETPYCQEWLNTTEDEICRYENLVDQYGAYVPVEDIRNIEKQIDKKLSNKFIEFWTEPIGRPITGLDFSSLYPSLIRAYNFSPEYCVLNKQQAMQLHAEGHKITKVDFDFHGKRKLAYFVWHNNKYDIDDPEFKFGVYPYILDDLFKKRAVLKKKMKVFDHRKEIIEAMTEEEQKAVAEEYADVVFNKNYLNSKQNALKVFMNTFYGEAGNKRSPFFVMEVAGGITTYGQKNIKFAYAFVKEKGCNVYYGDSVAEYTPILLRVNGVETYAEIRDIVDENEYKQYNDNKEIAILNNVEVWSDVGWTKVKHVIRHLTDKKMYRILTHSGVVDVTEDHSLLDVNGQCIKPNDCLGVALLTNEMPTINLQNTKEIKLKFLNSKNKWEIKSQIAALAFYRDCKALGLEITIDVNLQDMHLYTFNIVNQSKNQTQRKIQNIVKTIYQLPNNKQYVYDLETENHHFAAGVGNLIVHNTDSLYLSTPEQYFAEHDKQYYSNKLEKLDYWTKLVETTFREINPIRDGVNTAFLNDNGTKFLSMAYEEVLFPVAFTAKKKYFGIAHENIPNFKPKELFIRGLEVKKRGVSDLLKTICMEIMWTSCSVDNLYDLVELVLEKINYIYSAKWKVSDFIQTGVYKPTKKNVKIQTFVRRMLERNIQIKPNERFNYVIVKKYPYTYDHRGRKVELSIGDKLELADNFEKDGFEIDLDYYMQGSINGQLARLITYHDMFKVDPADTSDEELKIAEDRIYKNSCRFIEDYCAKYYASYNTFGKTHQKIFKSVNKTMMNIIKTNDQLAAELLGANVSYDDFENWFIEFTEKKATKLTLTYGEEFVLAELNKVSNLVKNNLSTDEQSTEQSTEQDRELQKKKIKQQIALRRKETLTMMQKTYFGVRNSILDQRELSYKNTMQILRKRLREKHQQFMKLYGKYNASIEEISKMMQSKLNITDEYYKPIKNQQPVEFKLEDFEVDENELLDDVEKSALTHVSDMLSNRELAKIINDLKILHNNMISSHILIKRTRSIVSYLKQRKNHENKMVMRPADEIMEQNIKADIDDTKEAFDKLVL